MGYRSIEDTSGENNTLNLEAAGIYSGDQLIIYFNNTSGDDVIHNVWNGSAWVSTGDSINWDGDIFKVIYGGISSDYISAENSSEAKTINASTGNDTITGGTGNDTLNGSSGNDVYQFIDNWGNDTITDPDTTGTLNFSLYTQGTGLTIDLTSTNLSDSGNSLSWGSGDILHAIGGAGNDTITGTNGNNSLTGGAGNDTITGGAGNDIFVVGAGDDTYQFANGWGNDQMNNVSDDGIDTYDLSAVTVNITGSLTEAGVLNEITDGSNWINIRTNTSENLLTGSGNDSLTGNDLDNYLSSGAGNDTLTGGNGNDTIYGGTGSDSMNGGSGNDTYLFGNTWGSSETISDNSGSNTIDFSLYTSGGLAINLSSGSPSVNDGTNSVSWTVGHIVHAVGGEDDDTITGDGSANNLSGNGGDDLIIAGDNEDTLFGGLGNDTLEGGTGNDIYRFFNKSTGFGEDIIDDASGSTDVLDLNGGGDYSFSTSDWTWAAIDTGSDTYLDALLLTYSTGNTVTIYNYFDNSSEDDDTSGEGSGVIEQIITSNNNNIAFADVQALIA